MFYGVMVTADLQLNGAQSRVKKASDWNTERHKLWSGVIEERVAAVSQRYQTHVQLPSLSLVHVFKRIQWFHSFSVRFFVTSSSVSADVTPWFGHPHASQFKFLSSSSFAFLFLFLSHLCLFFSMCFTMTNCDVSNKPKRSWITLRRKQIYIFTRQKKHVVCHLIESNASFCSFTHNNPKVSLLQTV